MAPLELIATSAFGLEAVVSRELMALGYTQQTVEDGRVSFQGDELAICRCNLWLRSADRVLVKVGQYPAKNFDQLFDQNKALPWSQWLGADAKFPVSGKSVRSSLHHTPSLQSLTKKSIVENLKQVYQRHWFQETGAEYPVEVGVLKDVVTMTIDTTGDGLHKRGYREEVGLAPLRETLAAALLLLSYWTPDRPFLDPFCGSGTIPIEAALIARNRAPGLDRPFLSETWPQIPRELWKQAREEARDLQRKKPDQQIIGCDIDRQGLALAKKHAEIAGVSGDLHFFQRDVLETKDHREFGVVVTNPPYGERIGDAESAEAIYDDMADAFAELKTWSIYVLTSHPGFEHFFRRRADRRRKLYNGRIECTLFQFFGPRPPKDAESSPENTGIPSAD